MAIESYISSCDWDTRWELEKKTLFHFNKDEVKEFFKGLGIGFNNSGSYWSNDNIELYCPYMSKNVAHIDDLALVIKNVKTGKYTMTWRNMNSYDGDTSNWHKIDDTVTPDEMKKFLRDYFQEWYDMKLDRTYVGKPSWANV